MTTTPVRGRHLSAGDVMSAPPLTVRPGASVWSAWTLMVHRGVRHLLVTEDGRCVGVLDDRTIFAQWPLGPAALHRRPVAAVMRGSVSCVPAGSDLRFVAEVMLRDGVDAVPVTDRDGLTVGVVTYTDILAAVVRVDDDDVHLGCGTTCTGHDA